MDNEPSTVRVPTPPGRGPSTLVLAAAILVAIAIVKPWSFGSAASGPPSLPPEALTSGAPASAASASAALEATPAPKPVAVDPNAMACMSSEGDRVLAFVRTPGLEVRTWLVLGNPSLADPLDPTAVPLRVLSSHVVGLGICARRVAQASPVASAAEILDVQAVTTSGGRAVLSDLGAPIVITLPADAPDMAVLYGPPVASLTGFGAPLPTPTQSLPRSSSPSATPGLGVTRTWPIGAYALAFRFAGDPPSMLRWVRLEIVPAIGMYD